MRNGLIEIPLNQIRPSAENPRKHFDQAELESLARSLASPQGVLEPILVRPYRGGRGRPPAKPLYELIAGERRWRAAKLAGLHALPAQVKIFDDRTAAYARLSENDDRSDIRPSERADAYVDLLAKGDTIESLAVELRHPKTDEERKKAVNQIKEILPIANCPAELREALDTGKVPQSTAGLVGRLPTPKLRDKVSWHVLSGSTWWGASLDDMQTDARREDVEVLTYAETRELIRNNCLIQLKQCPFDPEDGTLVPAAGSCTDCPKRAGNLAKDDPETWSGTRADVCTDPDCFATKRQAEADREAAKVLPVSRSTIDELNRAAEESKARKEEEVWQKLEAARKPEDAESEVRTSAPASPPSPAVDPAAQARFRAAVLERLQVASCKVFPNLSLKPRRTALLNALIDPLLDLCRAPAILEIGKLFGARPDGETYPTAVAQRLRVSCEEDLDDSGRVSLLLCLVAAELNVDSVCKAIDVTPDDLRKQLGELGAPGDGDGDVDTAAYEPREPLLSPTAKLMLRKKRDISVIVMGPALRENLYRRGIYTIGSLEKALDDAKDIGLGKEQEAIRARVEDYLKQATEAKPSKRKKVSA